MSFSLLSPVCFGSSAVALVATISPPAAGEQGCGYLHVDIDLQSRTDWAAEVPALRERLHALEHVDNCARVTIRAETNGVSVNVTSGGRSASRLLHEPSQLVRTVEALVVLPPLVDTPPTLVPAELPPRDAPTPPRSAETASSMEIGGGGSARWGGAPLMIGGGLAAFADLTRDRWSFGVNARWEFADGFVSAPTPSGFSMSSGAIGVAVGRRVAWRPFACDVLLGPSMVLETEETFGSRAASNEDLELSALDTRLDATLRASTPQTSAFHFYAALDMEVSPRRVLRSKRLDPTLPPLPGWTSGVSLGLTWGPR